MGSWRRGAGWPDLLARPWGQEGPAQPREPLCSFPSLLPLRPRAGNVLFPPLPPRGQRAGRAGWRLPCFPHLLPAQVRAGAATAAAPDSRCPRAGGAQGVGPGEGLGSLAGSGRAGATWRPSPAPVSERPLDASCLPAHPGAAARGLAPLSKVVGCGPVGASSQVLVSQPS